MLKGVTALSSTILNPDGSAFYREGTWTPVFTCATVGNLAPNYTLQVGTFTRIGRQVTINYELRLAPTHTTASGSVRITGLPFTNGASIIVGTYASDTGLMPNFQAGRTQINTVLFNADNKLFLYSNGSAANANAINITDYTTATAYRIYGTLTYYV